MKIISLCLIVLVQVTTLAPPAPKTTSIRLAWDYDFTAQPDVSQFKLYYGAGLTITNWNGTNVIWRQYTDFQPVGQVTNIVVTNLLWGKLYYFGITAVNTNGVESEWGNNEVRTNTPPKPSGPTNLRGP